MHPKNRQTFSFSTVMYRLIWCVLLLYSGFIHADILIKQPQLLSISETSLLKIEGNNRSDGNQILVIRADDSLNPSYANRANIERVIPRGEYQLHIPLASLRTPAGRQLNLAKLQQIRVFPGKKTSGFVINHAQIYTPAALAKNAFAWDLGPIGSAIWPGFKPLTIESGLLTGAALNAIDRSARMQAADPLTIDGIRGIESVALPLPAGAWQITLWMRDAGEWEYLPHPLTRRIYANGTQVHAMHRSPQQWIQDVYLHGKEQHVSPQSTSWTQFGQRQEQRISIDIISDGAPVVLRITGDSSDAQFINAIVATPKSNPEIIEMLTRQRKAWWEKNWPVAPWQKWPTGQPRLVPQQRLQHGAADTSALFEFEFEQGNIPGSPLIILRQPRLATATNSGASSTPHTLPATWHSSQWQLTRTHLSSTLLEANDAYLRFGLLPQNTGVAMPKRVIIRVDIPKNAPTGKYHGRIDILLQGKTLHANFSVMVVNAALPKLTKPVGIYLEKPVHFGWFDQLRYMGDDALLCDLTFLTKIGLTGISPPYPTPDNDEQQQQFENLSITLNKLGFVDSMAYAPAKRLSKKIGTAQAATVIADIEASHKNRLQNTPYWSIADEPSNPGNSDLFKKMHRNFKMFAPTAKLAGHLNHRDDMAYVSMFDLVLINDGFGIDQKDIQTVKKGGRQVWLYNLPHPRASSGFYLWQSGADGLLKWHGRMPTADPFDPTDGREYDAQFLFPSANPCPKEPDIHHDLYEIMEGIIDYRWLLWLTEQSAFRPDAKQLLSQLRDDVPHNWQQMQAIPTKQLHAWRQQIIALAL